jgi:hypothetical protein
MNIKKPIKRAGLVRMKDILLAILCQTAAAAQHQFAACPREGPRTAEGDLRAPRVEIEALGYLCQWTADVFGFVDVQEIDDEAVLQHTRLAIDLIEIEQSARISRGP